MKRDQTILYFVSLIIFCLILMGCSAPTTPEATPIPTKTVPLPTETISVTQTPEPPPIPKEIEITFIDNAGFLITAGDKKIIIDAIYEGFARGNKPPARTIRQIISGEPPFDNIDLLLITHRHFDHFSADLVTEFLHNHPETAVASTQGVVERLVSRDEGFAERLQAISLTPGEMQSITIAEIDLEAYYISHGDPDLPNIGFLITLPAGRVFHTGDLVTEAVSVADLVNYGLPQKQIDVALIPLYIFRDAAYHEHITEGIQANYVVPIHYSYRNAPEPQEILAEFPKATIFQNSMESWIMP